MTRVRGGVALAALAALVTSAASAACSGSRSGHASTAGQSPAVQPTSTVPAAQRAAEAARAPARSHPVTSLARRSIGPFAARTGAGAIAAWVTGVEKGAGQELVVVPLAPDGARLGDPQVVAKLPEEATSLVVRSAGASRTGWLVAWSALLDRGESLSVLALSADGSAKGSPVDLQRTNDHLAWFDLIPTSRGAVCAWAEETSSGDANILTAAIDFDGKARGMPSRVARGVERWQAVSTGDGVGLALAEPGPLAHSDAARPAGKLTWQRLDAEGQLSGSAIPIGASPTVSSDVDVVPVPGGWLLGWTDLGGEDAAVQLAKVDASGHVEGPTPALSVLGSSSLVALASGPKGAALAWLEPHARSHADHELHLAGVDLDKGLVARSGASVEVASPTAPEFVATDGGFALLAFAHACTIEVPAPCVGPVVPTFVRLGPTLAPEQAEPLYLGDERFAATLAWGLRCSGASCSVLAATSAAPTPVFTVDLPSRPSPFALPLEPPTPPDVARVAGIATVASGLPFSDVAATRSGDVNLVATLAGVVDTSPGRESDRPRGATILVHAVDDEGRALSPPVTVSSRAVPVGGVAIAAGAKADDAAAIAWVKRDGGDPQVHVALLDQRGKRSQETQLTTAKGDASSVAIARTEAGWLVAWVDSRDGNGEVYVAKIGRDLARLTRERRVTHAPGDAADVALAVRNGVGWLAWSDARETPREGLGDIYVAKVRPEDATRVGDEVRVLSSAPHSRSPEIVPMADGGALVAWIEDAPTGIEGPGAAMVARLDASGHVTEGPAKLPLYAPGRPTSLALSESGDGAHVVMARASGDTVSLDALSLASDGTPSTRAWPLLDLDAPAPFDVALAFAGDALFFDDVGVGRGIHRIRRVAISWRR
ncbi:MAG: hypothetical protein ACLP1X_16440 [Polyangiaceae bacterium]